MWPAFKKPGEHRHLLALFLVASTAIALFYGAGLMQTVASINEGMWWARSADFMQQGIMETFRWLRGIGDTIFGVGVVVLGWFVLGIKTGWSLTNQPDEIAEPFPESAVTEAVRR